MRYSLLSVLVASMLGIASFLPGSVRADVEVLLSESTFVYLADTESKALLEWEVGYLPWGTKFIRAADQPSSQNDWTLIETESGLLAYIKDGTYWNTETIRSMKNHGTVAMFVRDYPKSGKIGDLDYTLHFTRGEIYKIVEKNVGNIQIQLDLAKKLKTGENNKLILETEVPNNVIKIVDFSEPLKWKPKSNFQQSILNNVRGLEKPCYVQRARAWKVGGSVGIKASLDRFFLNFGMSAETETESIEKFEENKSVRRTYYTRANILGAYRITQYKECGGSSHIVFNVISPDGTELTIDQDWAMKQMLPVDRGTGKILVTCPEQYFLLIDKLIEQGFRTDEVPFLASKIGRWRGFGSPDCST